jgi:hypothetical protein
MGRKLLVCGIAIAAVAALPSPASAGDTRCNGLLVGTFDNVVVPRNSSCTLFSSVVTGNVTVRRGGSLLSQSNEIAGNVEGDQPRWVGSLADRIGGNFDITAATGPGFLFLTFSVNVFICGSTLTGGDVAVEKSRGGTVAIGSQTPFCPGNDVAGNILVQENLIPPGEVMPVDRNVVGGNVQVFKNRGMGAKSVVANEVRENVQCKENDEPFVGGPNLAAQAEEQCF